jgi:serine/threonine-protein kinase
MPLPLPSREDRNTLFELTSDVLVRVHALDDDLRAPEPSERVTLQPGDTVDHFAIDALIGSGGMGAVYRARDLLLGREVALKLVHGDMLDRPEVRTAFATEARAMAQVRHANVVTIHAFGEHLGRPYIVMEYVPGSNLTRWCHEHGDATLHEQLAVLDPLCHGVQAIHDAGTLHRDVKPANVLVEDSGRVAVTDFGLACAASHDQGDDPFVVGTPAYVAPEVAREEAIELDLAPRIDVYALGVIAFELLTGTRLFEATSVAGMLHEHGYASPSLASRLAPGLPPAFDDVLLRALAKAPADRTSSAEQLRLDLARARESLDTRHRRRRFLIADDEIPSLLALRELLIAAFPGAEVIPVTNTGTAVAIAMRERPDVVITDLAMPDGGGVVLTRTLRADPRTAHVPIIVVTGHGGTPEWSALRDLGADRFMVKPVDFDALVAMICALLRTSDADEQATMPMQ